VTHEEMAVTKGKQGKKEEKQKKKKEKKAELYFHRAMDELEGRGGDIVGKMDKTPTHLR